MLERGRVWGGGWRRPGLGSMVCGMMSTRWQGGWRARGIARRKKVARDGQGTWKWPMICKHKRQLLGFWGRENELPNQEFATEVKISFQGSSRHRLGLHRGGNEKCGGFFVAQFNVLLHHARALQTCEIKHRTRVFCNRLHFIYG